MTVLDKKASLNRVVKKTQVGLHEPLAEAPVVTAPAVPDFVPAKREDNDDQPPDNEKWEVAQERKKVELRERDIAVARMTETEQLGVDAGRCAEQVRKLRSSIRAAQKNLNNYTAQLAQAEAILVARLNELQQAGL